MSERHTREILIIDDNPADVRLIQEAVRGLEPPVDIREFSDGDQALQFLSTGEQDGGRQLPGLIFLDFHLPKAEPREVLRSIKQNRELGELAVVVLTTSNSEELIHEAYALGANCYLSKPSDLDTFFRMIQSAAQFWLNFPESSAGPRQLLVCYDSGA